MGVEQEPALPGWNVSGGCWARSGQETGWSPWLSRGPGLRQTRNMRGPTRGQVACLGASCRDRLLMCTEEMVPDPASVTTACGWKPSGSGLSSRRCFSPSSSYWSAWKARPAPDAAGSACFGAKSAFFLPSDRGLSVCIEAFVILGSQLLEVPALLEDLPPT